jgi:hypothetical protein
MVGKTTLRPILTSDRLPTMWTTYFIVMDGRKDIQHLTWILKRVERYEESPFIWYEEVKEQEPPAKRKHRMNPAQLCLFDDPRVQKGSSSKKPSAQSQPFSFSSAKPWESKS